MRNVPTCEIEQNARRCSHMWKSELGTWYFLAQAHLDYRAIYGIFKQHVPLI
jgi:hypothetical protein